MGFPEGNINLAQNDNIIGQIVIVSTMHGLQTLQHKMQGRFLFIALGVACAAMVVFYVLSRSLVAPISRLAGTAQEVARGDHNIRAVPDTVPETKNLALAFNSMLDSLQWSSQALEEAYQDMMQQRTLAELGRFAMTIAHEVKNPLGIIKSSLDMLKKEYGLTSDDMLVGYIEDEIQRLNRLIEDFLLFSKPAKAALVPIEMNGFLLQTVQRFEMQFRTGDIHMKTQLPSHEVWIRGDSDLLTRAVHNVLKNAIEASRLQGKLQVLASVEDNDILVRVRDQGPGIDPGLQEQIFDPFFTTRSQGTGLGLAYVAQVIAAHKGRIEAGNWDKGAEFRITLPLLGND
jgi:signal transduction histidine kinase